MRTVRISIASLDEFFEQAIAHLRTGQPQKEAMRFSYDTPESLFDVFTTARWQIIRVMTGAGPMTIRELASRLKRDIKSVYRDIAVLIHEDLVEHLESGAIEFPYDEVHVDFLLKGKDLTYPVAEAHVHLERPPRPPRRTPSRHRALLAGVSSSRPCRA